jgi:sugar lactone lactonase YvrE
MRRRFRFLSTLGLFAMFIWPSGCLACFCGTPAPEESARQVDLIVRGRVIAMTKQAATVYQADGVPQPITIDRVDLAVDTIWKGDALPIMSLIARESRGTSSCEYRFRLGGEYLVYASQPYGVRGYPAWLGTSICSWTRPLDQADDLLSLLGPGMPVRNAIPAIGGLGTQLSVAAARVGSSASYSGRRNTLDSPAGRDAGIFLEFGLWPSELAVDRQGRLYVTDADGDRTRILVYSPTGQPLAEIGQRAGPGLGTFYGVTGLAADSQGNIWVSDLTHWLRKFSPSGQELFRVNDRPVTMNLDIPASLAIDPDDNLYAVDALNSRLLKLSPSGTLVGQWQLPAQGSDRLPGIGSVAVDDAGRIYLADVRQRVIRSLAPDGSTIAEWGDIGNDSDPLGTAFALAVDRFGDVYIAEGGLNRVRQYSPLGELKAEWMGTGGAPGQFNAPWSIAADPQGNVYVADRFNYRIQVLPPAP